MILERSFRRFGLFSFRFVLRSRTLVASLVAADSHQQAEVHLPLASLFTALLSEPDCEAPPIGLLYA